jgi:uncharacterized protein YkwD
MGQGRRRRKGFLLVAATGLTLLTLALAGTAASATPTVTALDAREMTVVDRINQVRAANGLRPLAVAYRLTNAATRHANSMAKYGYAKHYLYTPTLATTWTPISTWIRWYWPGPGFTSWAAGENLAWGAPDLTVTRAMSFWVNSAPHRANILGNFNRIGVAAVHVRNPGGSFRLYDDVTFYAVEFGRRS